MSKKIVTGICSALFDSDLVATRLALALSELLWAVMLMWPGETFTRPTYSLMREMAPEMYWAVAFFVTAVIQYSIVAMDAYHSWWARAFACWNAWLWVMTVGAMLLSVYPPPAAIGGEIALMFSAVWIWVRPLIIQRGERLYVGS